MKLMAVFLTSIFLSTAASAQTEDFWGDVGDYSRVYIIPGEDHFADVCFYNTIGPSMDIHLRKLVLDGVEINIVMEHGRLHEPDKMSVHVPPGFTATPNSVIVKEYKTGCVRIEEILMG